MSPSWLKFSSGSLCNKMWAPDSFPCSAACPAALLFSPSVPLVVILQRSYAFSCFCTEELAVPSIWKMTSPHLSSLSARQTAVHPLGLGSPLRGLILTDFGLSFSHFLLPLEYYSWCHIVLEWFHSTSIPPGGQQLSFQLGICSLAQYLDCLSRPLHILKAEKTPLLCLVSGTEPGV